jgi:predicted dehydrogenase
MDRRKFLQSSGLAAAAPAIPAKPAANDRVGVAIIGCGGMGRNDMVDFERAGAGIVAVCDVFRERAEQAKAMADGSPLIFSDYREVIHREDVDAVVVATPDHWHPLIAIEACEAGKDVYVEKPISHNVREGRLMVEAARQNNRVVQVGIQQRSGAHFQRAVKAVRDGRIGDVHFAQCWNHEAGNPKGMGFPPDTEPPEGLDWDFWLGPAPLTPYSRARWNFRVFWDYAGGQLTNWCVHLIDVIHWALGVDAPLTVASSGGRFTKDARDCPDLQEVLWEYPGDLLVRYSTLPHNSFGPDGHPGNKPFGSYGIMFQGTKGTLLLDRAGYEIIPQMFEHREEESQSWREAFDDLSGLGLYYTSETQAERSTTSLQHLPHVRNFLECIKTRERPAGDIETGHRSTATCLLGNIAYRTGMKLKWDREAERFTNSRDANELLRRQYRPPWKLTGL